MISAANLDQYDKGRPLVADQIVEFHAARLILLIFLCGAKQKGGEKFRIDGLTKLAKLDFFVRYPDFFRRVEAAVENKFQQKERAVESAMIRHHYGPWDPRYYEVLAYLEGRELVSVLRSGAAYSFLLTPEGTAIARVLEANTDYFEICDGMRKVKRVLGTKSGDALKKLVYKLFDAEVAKLPLGRVIES